MMNKFYEGFPRLKEWMDEQKEFVKKHGYVDNWNGRRRRLPDALLPKYEITLTEKVAANSFNPLLECKHTIDDALTNKYLKLLENVKYRKDYEKIQAQALTEGVIIHSNGAKIAQAERQSVNYPCQSGGVSAC